MFGKKDKAETVLEAPPPPKRTRKKRESVPMTQLIASIPAELAEDLEDLLEIRGSTFSDFVRIAAKNYLRMPLEFTLTTKLTFGKYGGERLEAVMRHDPDYIRRCQNGMQAFRMDEESERLLDQLDPPKSARRRTFTENPGPITKKRKKKQDVNQTCLPLDE